MVWVNLRMLLWKLRWAGPRVRKLRRLGADFGYTPRPPDVSHIGETPKEFRDRLAWYYSKDFGSAS